MSFARNQVPIRRRSEIEVVAATAACILDSGLVAKTPENINAFARLLKVSIPEIRDAWTTGYSEPRPALVDGDTVLPPASAVAAPAIAPVSSSTDKLIEDGLASSTPRIRTLAERAQKAVEALRDFASGSEDRRKAEAEVERLKRELKAAQFRLKKGGGYPSIPRATSSRTANVTGPKGSDDLDMNKVRAWGKEQCLIEKNVYYVSQGVVDKYRAAHAS